MRTFRLPGIVASVALAMSSGAVLAQESTKTPTPPDANALGRGLYFLGAPAACTRATAANMGCATCHTYEVNQAGNSLTLMDNKQTANRVGWLSQLHTQSDSWAQPHPTTYGFWTSNPPTDELGATLAPADPSLRSQLKLSGGLVVADVQEGGRAARAGLKANDILLSLADQPLTKSDDLLRILKSWSQHHPADSYELKILRGGKPTSIKIKAEVRVVLAPMTEEAPKPLYFIGTSVNPLDATFRAQLNVPEGTGLLVGEVAEGSPAAKGGVKIGDILLQFQGQLLPDAETLRAKVQGHGPHAVTLEILREGSPTTLKVVPELRKPEPTQAQLTMSYDMLTANSQVAPRLPQVLTDLPLAGRFFFNEATPYTTQPNPSNHAEAKNTPPDLTKKIEELTAQVQALTKAVENLKTSQSQGEKK